MTALINWQDAVTAMLANSQNKQERPTPINLYVFSSQGDLQMSIDIEIENGKTMDIRKSNSALLEMAIADFSIVRTYLIELLSAIAFWRYWKMQRWLDQVLLFQVGRWLERRRGVPFFWFNFSTILTDSQVFYTGESINLNFENTHQWNRRVIMAQATIFGFGWLGDGTTIWHMPLLNMMVMCGDANPVVVSICDCTNHISEGWKKDTTFIAETFQEKVNEFEPKGQNTDVFVFDGAANVQKVGQILCLTFPPAYCFHGGEHVLSLFFNDLPNLKHILVRQSNLLIFWMIPC